MQSSKALGLLASLLMAGLTAGPLNARRAQGQGMERPESVAPTGMAADSVEKRNADLARAFYEDLWFSDRTDRWDRYVADEYVVHDIGDTKGVVEPGVRQKEIADFFRAQGEMGGSIDFQIAQGDLVATRWQWDFRPTSLRFRLLGGRERIPIINVFRFQDGKIVEIWNHRHDIDTGLGNIPFVQGLGVGLLLALIGWGLAFVQWRRARRAASP
ncbi:MAG: nuclear transport factor 2 family protein [Gemmatimonadota bacterium]|jgi:predicted SnoaL-like aldol condensation-catalyzing enzyme